MRVLAVAFVFSYSFYFILFFFVQAETAVAVPYMHVHVCFKLRWAVFSRQKFRRVPLSSVSSGSFGFESYSGLLPLYDRIFAEFALTFFSVDLVATHGL